MTLDENNDDAIHDETIHDTKPDVDDATQRQPSIYEKIMVAAREAKRLNAAVQEGQTNLRKSTTLAMKRVNEDGVAYRFRDTDEVKAPIAANEFEANGEE